MLNQIVMRVMNFSNLRIFFIVPVLFLSACAVPRMFTTLEVLRPADISFAPQVQNILIVDNAAVQAYNTGHTDFRSFSEYATPEQVELRFDSAAIFAVAALRESLEEKAFFQSVKLADSKENRSEVHQFVRALSLERVAKLSAEYRADAIIVLDYLHTDDFLYYPGDNAYGVLDVEVSTKWSLYYPGNAQRDTISFFDAFSWENRRAKELPNRYDALVDASILAGYNCADRMTPRWEKQDRYLYVPSKPQKMKDGQEAFEIRDWEMAILYWSEAENSSQSTKTKFRATNNMAVAHEIMGDYEKASQCFDRAINYYQDIVQFSYNEQEISSLLEYWQFLKNRKKELELLNVQLGE